MGNYSFLIRYFMFVIIVFSQSSCGLFFRSYQESIVVKEFNEQQELRFKIPSELNARGIYKIEICIEGKISGTIVLDENENKQLNGEVKQCYKEDWYQDSYTLTIRPKTSILKGELTFKTKFFY